MAEERDTGIDLQNRHLEQEAQTDTDLETVVPPTSPMWGPTTWWRLAIAALGVIVIVTIVVQAL